MSDKTVKDDEEYKYPEEEYVVDRATGDENTESDAVKSAKPSGLKLFVARNKRLLGVAGVAVVAIIAFQVMSYETNNKVIQDKPAPVVHKVQPKPVQQTAVLKGLDRLQQTGLSNSQEIDRLNNEVSDMHSQLQQSTETNAQLRKAMVLLLEELKQMNSHLQTAPVTKPTGPPKPHVTYNVRAMIDNRAWIEGSNGISQSVTVGDPIADYGLVKKIDAVTGMIVTTSGKVIKLGGNDY